MNKKILVLMILVVCNCKSVFANQLFKSEKSYLPYLQLNGARFFNVRDYASTAVSLDLFFPVWQTSQNLVFTDMRLYDHPGAPFEGNIHFGYRNLFADGQMMYGMYGAFDRKRSEFKNYFNQLTLGLEFWLNKVYLGGSYSQHLGSRTKSVGVNVYENKLDGGEAEVGYEVVKGLVGYVGGYFLKANDGSSIHGPRVKLSYDFLPENSQRVLNVFDQVGLETGVQHDRPRGTSWFLSLNFRIGLSPHKYSSSSGVARHMSDLIHCNIDIATVINTKKTSDSSKNNTSIENDPPANDDPPPPGPDSGSTTDEGSRPLTPEERAELKRDQEGLIFTMEASEDFYDSFPQGKI